MAVSKERKLEIRNGVLQLLLTHPEENWTWSRQNVSEELHIPVENRKEREAAHKVLRDLFKGKDCPHVFALIKFKRYKRYIRNVPKDEYQKVIRELLNGQSPESASPESAKIGWQCPICKNVYAPNVSCTLHHE